MISCHAACDNAATRQFQTRIAPMVTGLPGLALQSRGLMQDAAFNEAERRGIDAAASLMRLPRPATSEYRTA
jgi:hypothetical protein